MTQRVSDNSELSCVCSTILQPTVICAVLGWSRRDMPNIFFHLPLPAQFAWNRAEENMVGNKANPLEKKIETPALEINASTENPLIEFPNRLGFFNLAARV